MQKEVRACIVFIVVAALAIFLLPEVSAAASSVNNEIQRLTWYAQQYETGNINYAQFSVYLASVQSNLNAALGATRSGHENVLKASQLEAALGVPTEKTRWVWAEKEDREVRREQDVPAWRTIVFDGNKIQIRLNAWPYLRRANDTDVRYRLHTEITLKKSEDAFDGDAAIDRIQGLAEAFAAAPTPQSAETLARASVAAERRFSEFLERSPNQCEETIRGILGTDVQRREQQTVRKEITLHEGKNYEGMLVMESCEECEWRWLNLHAFVNTHGSSYPGESGSSSPDNKAREAFKHYTPEQFKEEIRTTLAAMKAALEQRRSIREHEQKLRALNDAWNEQANDVHRDLEQEFRKRRESLPAEALRTYDWRAEENERRQRETELRNQKYEERTRFYTELFASYEMREQRFKEVSFERRLVETSRTVAVEQCSNKKDDDGDNAVDCADEQCGGNWCGTKGLTIAHEGREYQIQRDLYCRQSACQLAPEAATLRPYEVWQEPRGQGEEDMDRRSCKHHEPIACSGIVLFKGVDARGCPLPPVCVQQQTFCSQNSDCPQPRCGSAACVTGACKVANLEACKEAACTAGEQRTQHCASGETLVTEICIEGNWQSTDQACTAPVAPDVSTEAIRQQPEQMLSACAVKEDCAEREVCSNSRCVAIPEVRGLPVEEVRAEARKEAPETATPATPQQSAGATAAASPQPFIPAAETAPSTNAEKIAGAVTAPFRFIGSLMTGRVTGSGENVSTNESQSPPATTLAPSSVEPNVSVAETNESKGNNETISGNESTLNGNNLNETGQKRNESQTFKQGERNESRIERKSSPPRRNDERERDNESRAAPEQARESAEEPQTHRENAGGFNVGGSCKESQERREAHIHFGGWGAPFEEIEPLKQRYYQGNNEWCTREYENAVKQRWEFEASFNEQFAAWFFEKHLANAADDWEQQMSGIFDLYWRDIELSRQLAQGSSCLDLDTLPPHTLLNFKYETEYGKIEFWEEIKEAKINPNDDETATLISPYMRVFIFPPKEFIRQELRSAMGAHAFPGSPEEQEERESEEGLTDAEKVRIKQDEKFMGQLREFVEPYDGKLDASLRLVDGETNEVVFNLYVQVNEQDIMKIQPMPPEAQPVQDVVVSIDFERMYSLIDFIQRKMEGGNLESPPWDKKPRRVTETAKDVYNGIRVWLKVQSIIRSAEVTPASDEGEIKDFVKAVIWKIMTEGDDEHEGEGGGREEERGQGAGE